MSTRSGVYVRISEDREGAGLGVARQEADCRALADRLGWTVERVYIDNDLSAFRSGKRPAYAELLANAEVGGLDAILAWHTDRLHRSPLELEGFIDICERRGLAVQTVTAGPIDLTSPSGRMIARQLGAVARYESEHKAERQRRKARELAEAGKLAGGGTRPYGFASDRRTVNPDEAAVIRECAQRLLAGEPLRNLARDLNHRGVATVTGAPWSTQVLRGLLMSGRVAGWREHHQQLTAPGDWQSIIDRPTLDRLRSLLLDPGRRTTTGPTVRKYLLAGGLARCARCGAPLRGAPRADGTRRYICRRDPTGVGCNGCAIVADELEAHVREAVLDYIDTPALAAAIEEHEHQGVATVDLEALHRDEEALEELARDYYAERRLSRGEYDAAREALQARVKATRARMTRTNGTGRLRAVLGLGKALREAWEAEPFDWRRALILAVVERVTVGPGRKGYNRFDPRRVTISWRY
jgi:site-specific DNA recombinase